MRVVVVAGLTDHKLRSKIAPILALEDVSEVFLIRRHPLVDRSVHNVNPPEWMRRVVVAAEVYRILSLLVLCLRRPRPDVLIGIYMMPHGIYASIADWLLRIPRIQLIIGTDLEKTLSSPLLIRLLRGADFLGARGPQTAARLVAAGIPSEKIFYPPNVFDVSQYEVARDIDADKEYDLIYVGSLVPVKRVEVLIETVKLLREDCTNIRLVIAGDGPLRENIETLVTRWELAENVDMLGKIPASDVGSFLNRSRIFVMTSGSEGLPMAMVEALSCGLPVVVPDVGDISTVVQHGENGLLVSRGTPENFAEAVRRLLKDGDYYRRLQRGALRSRKRFRAENSLEAAVEEWASVLNKVKS